MVKVFVHASVIALALFVALLTPGSVRAATVASDDFSSGTFDGGAGWSAVWQVTGAVDIVNIGGQQADGQMRLRGAASVAYRDVDLDGWTGPELAVWVKASGLDDEDFVILRAGPPGALSELRRWTDEDADGEYHAYSFELSHLDTSGIFRVHFESRFQDGDGAFLIDSVAISDDRPPSGSTNAPPPEEPRPTIVLDGRFDEWAARASISDIEGDARNLRGDIVFFYWGDNDNDETMYWMVQRPAEERAPVAYSVHLDMDNNGSFRDSADRIVEVRYFPRRDDSKVDLKVRRATNNGVLYLDMNNDWGESLDEGGSRVEFGVPFEVVGFTFGSALRMYVESDFGDRAPDAGDIQWSPIPVLGYAGAALALVLGAAGVWWLRLRHFRPKRY